MALPKRIFIDALPLSTLKVSGVGYATHGLIQTLIDHPDFQDYEIVLVTTIRGYRWLKAWNFRRVRYVKLPVITRVMNRLPATPLLPWMDLLLGRGIYLFPNFRSWPLLFSPSAVYVHDVAFIIHPDSVAARNRQVLLTNVPRWAKRATKVVTVSENSKAEIAEHLHLSPERIIVAYNGVDTTDLYPRPAAEIAAAQARHGLPANYVLYLGNIEPRKNLARVIRAYTALPRALRDQHPLVLVGGGGWLTADIDEAMEQAAAAGATVIRPSSYVDNDDRPAVFSGATALIWPPIHEGFGMPPLEAMACGVPVLTSDIPVLQEVVGDAALLADPLDEAALTKSLQQILTDQALRTRLIAAGHERVKQFTWDRGLAGLFDWIKSVSR